MEPLISKKEFCEIINFIKESYRQERELNHIISKISYGAELNLFDGWSDVVIGLLENIMRDHDDNFYGSKISYFIFGLDFGEKQPKNKEIDEFGKPIIFSSAEILYDYLKNKNF